MQIKKVTMDHFNLIQNTFKRDKNKKNLENKKHPGCNINLYFSHNFNGTSKGVGETNTKPSVVPSQLVLNEIRRGK